MTGAIAEAPSLRFESFREVHDGLMDRALARSIDAAQFERGNIREGAITVIHGEEHRARREVEIGLFERAAIDRLEAEAFLPMLAARLDGARDSGGADLVRLGRLLAVGLAGRICGLDLPGGADDDADLDRLIEFVEVFALGAAIESATGDRDRLNADVSEALHRFDGWVVAPSRARRRAMRQDSRPLDLLSALEGSQGRLGLDDATILRETALYLAGAVDTTAQALVNAFDAVVNEDGLARRAEADPDLAQRCIHESLRLRPILPVIRRRAIEATRIGATPVGAGTIVLLDCHVASRDASVFGSDADDFDADRALGPGIPRYGLAFGGGMHACIGKTLAGGQPIPLGGRLRDGHRHGLLVPMLRGLLSRGAVPDASAPGVPETRTAHWTRWISYPLRFTGA